MNTEMRFHKISLTFLVFLLSCEVGNAGWVNPKFDKYLQKFQDEAKSRGVKWNPYNFDHTDKDDFIMSATDKTFLGVWTMPAFRTIKLNYYFDKAMTL